MSAVNILLCYCIIVFGTTSVAVSQPTTARYGFGPQAGFSIDPGQLIVGGQAIFRLSDSPIHLGTSIDFGMGADQTITTLYFDVTYDFVSDDSRTVWYAGGGPTVAFIAHDDEDGVPGLNETKGGVTLIGGVRLTVGERSFFNASFRPSFGDVHELKFMIGYMFGFGGI